MKKTIWVITFFVLAIIAGFVVGIYLYNLEDNKEAIENDTKNIVYSNLINNSNTVEIQTSTSEEKISVNTQVIEEVYYVQCDHLIATTRKDIKALINMTKEELAEKYPNWEIKEFSLEKVVLYKEEDDFCNEHYIVKDVDGFITIYNMDKNDEINEIIEITEIETKYLTQNDQEDLKEGIKVYSQQKLNKLIEDFE